MRSWIFASGLLVLLAGCSATTSVPLNADAGSPPVNYRQAVIDNVKTSFFDPYSIRDAEISKPLYASAIFNGSNIIPGKAWVVCVKANAKNRMGGYIGRQLTLMVFKGEVVEYSLSESDAKFQIEDHCKTATFEPFDEIEQQ